MLIKRLLGAATALALVHGAARADEIRVFAAASTTNALTEIAESFKAKTGHTVQGTFAASSGLARQIEQGAPANLFLSADTKWMDYLAARKFIADGSRSDLLGNRLVLIAPADSPLDKVEVGTTTDLVKLLGDGRLATGDPDHVPVGLYARQALEAMGQWQAVEARLARTGSVRSAVALVERGEAPLGIVYSTDAAVAPKVKVLGTFPETLHETVVYPVGLVAGKDTPAAKALLDFLKSDSGKAVFVKYGFKVN